MGSPLSAVKDPRCCAETDDQSKTVQSGFPHDDKISCEAFLHFWCLIIRNVPMADLRDRKVFKKSNGEHGYRKNINVKKKKDKKKAETK